MTVVLGIGARRATVLLVTGIGLVAVGAALNTTARVSRVERAWGTDSTGVRWQLVDDAFRHLDDVLLSSVDRIQDIAERAEALVDGERAAAFAKLEDAVEGDGAEVGVLILDGEQRPWAWAGRHRLPFSAVVTGLDVRITPFYATLDAWRQTENGYTVVAHVLLDADQAVPDRERTLRTRFAITSGVDLEFYAAGRGPWADVFDYCLPSCTATDVVPDTLFSVRLVPPTQGTYKLDLLAGGERRVAVLIGLFLLGAMLLGGRLARGGALLALGGLLVFTPAGSDLRLGTLFSPATFFTETLGPVSDSAGALLTTAILALIAAVALFRWGVRRGMATIGVAAVLIVTAPYLLGELASGITPPAAGSDVGLWLQWELPIAVASAALLLLAAGFVRGRDLAARAPGWMSLVAAAWAVGAALVGLLVWQPISGWPYWYLYLWLPAIVFAIQPGPRLRVVATLAVVSGSASALLTWGAAADGRRLLAERDMVGLRQGGDPVAVGLLEQFGSRLQEEELPQSAAELFSRWSRSSLYEDGYPALLVAWSRNNAVLARLDLAELALADELAVLQRQAAAAVETHVPVVRQLERVPGMHYVLSVPYPDGSAVSVAIGPRSRAIAPVRIAQFLRGEPTLPPPYQLTLSEPIVGAVPLGPNAITWRRDGRVVRGEALLQISDAARHLHAAVQLGTTSGVLIRGVLVVALDVALIVFLWLFGEAALGGVRVPPVLIELVSGRSYRTRLGLAFAVFFVIPTVGFAAWSARRLQVEAEGARDLVIRQTLADAAGTVTEFPGMPAIVAREFLADLGGRLSSDLVLYEGSELSESSAPVLIELSVLDQYLSRNVERALVIGDQLEYSTSEVIAGSETRVGYRDLGGREGREAILAAPRLVEDPLLIRNEQDLLFGLLLVTLGGMVAAAVLATVAAGALAKPVQALREAAEQVGRGVMPSPFGRDTPGEFVPVMTAFERMASDVSASRRAVEEQRQRTVAVLRNVATGVVALDDRLCVTMANPRAEELLGCRLVHGLAIAELSHEGWMPVWEWVRAAARGLEDTEPTEFTIDETQVRVQMGRLRGTASGWVVALDDVTDLARAVRVLAWGELARQVAHEIKNPLTPIRLGIQHLRRSFNAPRGDYAETLDRTSKQMLAEIERLDAIARAFSRFGAPPAEAEPLEVVDLVEVARDTAALYTLGESDAVRVESEGPATGTARRDELKEVLINLIENARTAGARHVTISLAAANETASIALRDDGQGIPPEDLPRIFEPQFSTTTSGTGLGLAICKRLVESWGGEIAVESGGDGTTVTIRVS